MTPLSGVKTVTTTGTAEALGSQQINARLAVKALSTNTNAAYIGEDGSGDVASTNGYELAPSAEIIFEFVGDLSHLMVDVSTNGDGVCWLVLSV